MLLISTDMKYVLLASCLLLVGCSDAGMGDLKQWVDSAYTDTPPEIEPLPEIEPAPKFNYSASALSDPFSIANVLGDIDVADVGSALRPDANRVREPLEDVPLDALRMVGTLAREGEPFVVMQTNKGTAHFLKAGNYLGQNNGQIISIDTEQQKVMLTETVLNSANRWETRDVELTLQE